MPRLLLPLVSLGFIVSCVSDVRSVVQERSLLAVPTLAQDGTPSSDDPPSLTAQADRLVQAGNVSGAQALLLRVLAASPNDPAANLLLGELLLTQQHYPEAMDRFETVLAVDLRSPRARAGELQAATRLALQARNAGKPEAALACLDHASKSLPDDPTLLLDLGLEADQVRQYPMAQEALETALKLRPNDPPTLYALGRLETDEKNLAAAELHLRQYLVLRPDDASAHFGLGHVLVMAQRVPEARAEFDRSVALQPVQTESYYQLGQIETDLQHDAAARPLLERVLARDPNHGGALTAMGILAYRAKSYPAARSFLEHAVTSAPDYQPAHYYLGLTLGRLGEKASSDEQLKIAVDLAHRAQQNRE